jgi:hypothetical protein
VDPDTARALFARFSTLESRLAELQKEVALTRAKAWCYWDPGRGMLTSNNIRKVDDNGMFVKFWFEKSPGEPYIALAVGQAPQKVSMGSTHNDWFDVRDVGPADRRLFVIVFGGGGK